MSSDCCKIVASTAGMFCPATTVSAAVTRSCRLRILTTCVHAQAEARGLVQAEAGRHLTAVGPRQCPSMVSIAMVVRAGRGFNLIHKLATAGYLQFNHHLSIDSQVRAGGQRSSRLAHGWKYG
jgi:hypothetical protein